MRSVCADPRLSIAPIILKCGLCVPGKLLAPLASAIEAHSIWAPVDSDVLASFAQVGELEFVSDAPSLEDFVEARRVLYRFDRSRYSAYFSDADIPTWMVPRILNATSATDTLARAAEAAFETSTSRLGDVSTRFTAGERKSLQERLRRRGARALTMSLFDGHAAPSSIRAIGRFLSERYVGHYTSFLDADILTGLPGLQYFDELGRAFPLLDLPCLDTLLQATRACSLVDSEGVEGTKRVVAQVVALRSTPIHAAVASAFQEVIEQARPMGEGRDRSHVATRSALRASVVRAISNATWRPLSWESEGEPHVLLELISRLEHIKRRVADQTGALVRTPNWEHTITKEGDSVAKCAFLSYVREDAKVVDALCARLRAGGLEIWQDRDALEPGVRWKVAIRQAISKRAFAFVACFSEEYQRRPSTYMNEELLLAIEEIRKRPQDRAWFIPVRLNDVQIPDRSIGGGETLQDIQHVDVFPDWDAGCDRLIAVLRALA